MHSWNRGDRQDGDGPADLRYIQRIERGAYMGWVVLCKRRKRHWSKCFTDSLCGGKQAALEAAILWRDQLVREITGPAYVVWYRERKTSANTSGHVGVTRSQRRTKTPSGYREWHFWVASWVEANGRRRYRSFGVERHGEHRAKVLALLARERGIRDIEESLRQKAGITPQTRHVLIG